MEFPGALAISNWLGASAANRISLLYVFCVCLSFMEYVVAFMTASIHLMFTEPLNAENAAQYFTDNLRAPAEPLLWFLCAAFWHIIATTIIMQASFGEGGWSFIIWMFVGVLWIGKVWRESSLWAPRESGPREKGGPGAIVDQLNSSQQ
jgi:hypothetical protein